MCLSLSGANQADPSSARDCTATGTGTIKKLNSNPGALQRRRMSTGLDRYTGCATNRHNIMLVETARRHSFCVTFYHQENTEDVATAGRRRTGTT